jgi:uncharacterized spore protein YtfJ
MTEGKMEEEVGRFFVSAVRTQEQAMELMAKLVDVAKPGTVFSEPVTAGEYTVITASEVSVGLGFGFGSGGGSGPAAESSEESAGEGEEETEDQENVGAGGGGGGGGGSMARPVAYIAIGPTGVRMEPMFDLTKVALAFFTMLGSVLVMRSKMRRG